VYTVGHLWADPVGPEWMPGHRGLLLVLFHLLHLLLDFLHHSQGVLYYIFIYIILFYFIIVYFILLLCAQFHLVAPKHLQPLAPKKIFEGR